MILRDVFSHGGCLQLVKNAIAELKTGLLKFVTMQFYP